jgi:hypothetical protein
MVQATPGWSAKVQFKLSYDGTAKKLVLTAVATINCKGAASQCSPTHFPATVKFSAVIKKHTSGGFLPYWQNQLSVSTDTIKKTATAMWMVTPPADGNGQYWIRIDVYDPAGNLMGFHNDEPKCGGTNGMG